jgi:ubiquinone/menaquinone biosynthesis C-methylase UbiE/uncharacterized protein YbaR (Trm112 family)
MIDYSILMCPITKNGLELLSKEQFTIYNLPGDFEQYGQLTSGLVDSSKTYFYPMFNEIIVLLPEYAIFIGNGIDSREKMSFDKKRVFDYYNEVDYKIKDSYKIYSDSQKWVDFRDVSKDYINNSLTKASRFYASRGKYLLDIASGPIGLPQYMDLSKGYEYRICVDISINALIEAKLNMEKAGQQGIFICGDITSIPIKDNICDTVLCQHTLYHIPKKEQFTAVNELYRVGIDNSKIVIIYNWFMNSWFMNISLHFIQLYRIIRHYAGKLYVRLTKSKPRLYFFTHTPKWFKRSFPFSRDIEFYCWRSTNKYFLDLYIHKWFFGRAILKRLQEFEDKHSKFMGTFGDYPAIVITKKNNTN